MPESTPHFLLLGQLRREYILAASDKVVLDQMGGNLLYAAGGLGLWAATDEPIGLVARVGEDYPREWLADIQKQGMNADGIRILSEPLDLRAFYAYSDTTTRHVQDPVQHFARRGLSFPRTLLGFRERGIEMERQKQLGQTSLRGADLPDSYHDAVAAHLCPLDFLSHSLMPAELRQAGVTTVTLDPGAGYMHALFWDEVPGLLPGLAAFLPAEEDLRELFRGRTEDIWEMAEALGGYGCEVILITAGARGQYLYDATARARYEIPAYPARVQDVTGAGDAFAGGFLAGYQHTFDPLLAALYGNVSASLAVEGLGPFFPLEALPGLQQARLETLTDLVRRV